MDDSLPPFPPSAMPPPQPLPPQPPPNTPAGEAPMGSDLAPAADIGTRLAGVAVAIVVLNIAWAWLGTRDYGVPWPSQREVLTAFKDLATDGAQGITLGEHLGATLGRIAYALGLGLLVGVAFGLAAGAHPIVSRLLDPLFSFLRVLLPAGIFMVALLSEGIGNAPLKAAATLPAVWFVADGVRRLELTRKPVGALAIAQLASIARSTLLIVWIVVSFSELVAVEKGLGAGMWRARSFIRLDQIVVYALVSTLILLVLDYLIRLVFWFARTQRAN